MHAIIVSKLIVSLKLSAMPRLIEYPLPSHCMKATVVHFPHSYKASSSPDEVFSLHAKTRLDAGALHGTPEGIRTSDLWYRKPTLYPAELRVRARKV